MKTLATIGLGILMAGAAAADEYVVGSRGGMAFWPFRC
jgi:hypothetical protein